MSAPLMELASSALMATFGTKPSSGRPLPLAKPISLDQIVRATNRGEDRWNSESSFNQTGRSVNFGLLDIPSRGHRVSGFALGTLTNPEVPGFDFWRPHEATDQFPSRFEDFLKTTCPSPRTASCGNSRLGRRQALENQAAPAMERKGASGYPHGFTLGAGNYDPAHMASGCRKGRGTRSPDQWRCETNATSGRQSRWKRTYTSRRGVVEG